MRYFPTKNVPPRFDCNLFEASLPHSIAENKSTDCDIAGFKQPHCHDCQYGLLKVCPVIVGA